MAATGGSQAEGSRCSRGEAAGLSLGLPGSARPMEARVQAHRPACVSKGNPRRRDHRLNADGFRKGGPEGDRGNHCFQGALHVRARTRARTRAVWGNAAGNASVSQAAWLDTLRPALLHRDSGVPACRMVSWFVS